MVRSKSLSCEKGQSLVEAIFAIHILVAIVSGTFIYFGHSFTKACMQYILHESLVCTVREDSPAFCIQKGKEKFQQINAFGNIVEFSINKKGEEIKGLLKWKIYGNTKSNISLIERQTLKATIID